jgi:hypothetical protein
MTLRFTNPGWGLLDEVEEVSGVPSGTASSSSAVTIRKSPTFRVEARVVAWIGGAGRRVGVKDDSWLRAIADSAIAATRADGKVSLFKITLVSA